jgi:repressor LexA
MEKLTKRQEDTLNFIKEYIVAHGYPPTVREIAKELDVSSPATVQAHLDRLADKGYIKKGSNKNRTIELMVDNEFRQNNDSVVDVPLLGKITAGSPIEAIENPNNFFTIPTSFIPRGKELFALTVDGESMINKGILSDDIVIVERTNTAHNGEMVVAMNDNNEVTLKTFYKEDGHFRLQPENDTMAPIILDNVTVLGKAIGLYRKF